MSIGDIVIVREDAENWASCFMQKRKFIVNDFISRDGYDYALRTYNWPQKLKEDVFSNNNDFVFINESDRRDLIILDREFIKINPIQKLKLQ